MRLSRVGTYRTNVAGAFWRLGNIQGLPQSPIEPASMSQFTRLPWRKSCRGSTWRRLRPSNQVEFGDTTAKSASGLSQPARGTVRYAVGSSSECPDHKLGVRDKDL